MIRNDIIDVYFSMKILVCQIRSFIILIMSVYLQPFFYEFQMDKRVLKQKQYSLYSESHSIIL